MADEGFKRKLTAILSADVEGYSRLMGDDEEATVRTLTSYREVLTTLIRQHNGIVLDSPGDNLLAEFVSVVDAVQCAVAVQKEIHTRNEALPENRRMQFRIGINLGDVIQEKGRIYGDGVNIAARLEGLADPGGICISKTAFDHIESKLPYGYDFIGEQTVKNIAKPVGAYRVQLDPRVTVSGKPVDKKPPVMRRTPILVAAGVALVLIFAVGVWQFYARRPTEEPASLDKMAFPLPEKPSIAVLPFDNLSGDPEQEYFADGMTDDLITDLSKISGIFVIAHNSTFQYKGKSVDARKISRELGVRYVLEGTVRRAEDQIRINAQLIDATTGRHFWADRYDGKLEDVFALQDKITGKIVTALAVKLTGVEQEQITRKDTDNIAAYDAFLKGWGHYLRRTPEDFAKARSYFKKALELDPNYGKAYAALAKVYWSCSEDWDREYIGVHKTLRVSWFGARIRAREYLEIAMKRPTSIAYTLAVEMNLFRRLHKKAIAEAERAIAISPNESDSHTTMAKALIFAGRPKEALDSIERAMRLDPHNIAYPLYLRGLSQFSMGQLKEAVSSIDRALTHNPELGEGSGVLAVAYAHLGRDQEARAGLVNYMKGVQSWWIALDDVMLLWPFKDSRVAERFADGLLKAGLPGEPSGYYKIYEENHLTGEEIKELVFGRAWTGIMKYREEYRIDLTMDGKATYHNVSGAYFDPDDKGKSWIAGDMFCSQWESHILLGQCWTVFSNPKGTKKLKNEYFALSDYDIITFSVEE